MVLLVEAERHGGGGKKAYTRTELALNGQNDWFARLNSKRKDRRSVKEDSCLS